MEKTVRKLYITNRKEWRRWLKENHETENGIWLIYFKKHTDKPRIPYDDAVEEALCFGWIDSTVKRIDDETYMQKFTPRKDKSIWSDANKKRVRQLMTEGRMTGAGRLKVNEAKKNGSWKESTPIYNAAHIPTELKSELSSNKEARAFYNSLAPSYKKQYNWWIISAKREATKNRRIKEAVRLLEKQKKLGM